MTQNPFPSSRPDSRPGARHGRPVWTREAVRQLGMTTDIPTAAEIIGIGRTLAFELLRKDEFPVPVLRIGRRVIVPVSGLLRLLGDTGPGTADDGASTSREQRAS